MASLAETNAWKGPPWIKLILLVSFIILLGVLMSVSHKEKKETQYMVGKDGLTIIEADGTIKYYS
jgi:hypothetical protein